ncbi:MULTISPECIES: phage tail protein [unclassified Pseudomonas]|jgi:microcystin-dependent protein|uniref:phage tail protein n=1 Tax=unclassified Pseudomonas TaxID=196821 RepID=UPI000BA4681C|nr:MULTISPECIES: tail fiber protein [unclassified Pseudomonas]MCU1723635.1 tail fiber protein [Pseudomonas sp. 5P_5.1_Bac1]MCU1732007.1 tail fiber protein [Pseudomonas sp. 20P_3.2_Bac4]MCU1744903.1 tail fiber protein [Pseudomonas sp. 20P_3.2_Bac5]
MSDPFIGEIKMFGGNFAPRGYSFCNGQLLPLTQNTALFAILGTTYGGNGQSTFGLPDFRGRSPLHWGQGTGLTNILLGEVAGAESVTQVTSQMPAHIHQMGLTVSTANATSPTPIANGYLGAATDKDLNPVNLYTTDAGTPVALSSLPSTITGGSQPFGIRNPFLAVSFIIALVGEFPSRN